MKKLFVLALTALAVSAQGAAVLWNSGVLRNPDDDTGAFAATGFIAANAGIMRVWFFTSLDNAQAFMVDVDTGRIFEQSGISAADATLLHTGSTVSGTPGQTSDNTAPVGGSYSGATGNWFAPDGTYFTAAYVETELTGHTDPAMNIRWFMWSPIASFTQPGAGSATINFATGIGLGGVRLWPDAQPNGPRWTPIPEPSTGLLAVAGLGLLLRRRRRSVA